MSPPQSPREFFPNMPDEAFDMWLAPLITRYGWPLLSIDAAVSIETKWGALLANIPLAFWHSSQWELRNIELTPKAFAFSSQMLVDSIVDHCTRGAYTMTANLGNTNQRFRALAEYVSINGRIPLPVVAVPRHGRFELVDGHHRIAAVFHCGIAATYRPPAYVAHFESHP